jgi:hypothetical protein
LSNIARRFGVGDGSVDPKLKVAAIPQKPAVQADAAMVARLAKMEAELKAAIGRIAALEASVTQQSNAVTPTVTTKRNSGNALSAAEKQRAYRARQKARNGGQDG